MAHPGWTISVAIVVLAVQQSAPACPKTVGTGAFLIGYRGQMIGGLVPALGDPPVSPLVVGGTGKTTAERIASELNSL